MRNKNVKEKTSFTLENDILKALKIKAIELGMSQTKLLEKFIEEGLKSDIITDNRGTLTIEDIKPNLLKSITKIAKDKKITEKEAINKIIEKGIKNTEVIIPDRYIANKDTYNPDHKRRMKMAGIIKTEEPFNTLEAIEEVRTRDY